MITINIAKEFTDAPGGRLKTDGEFSGEEFREIYLEKYFKDDNDSKIMIILDGTYGYGTSFLEEAFGGLARIYGTKRILKNITFISDEEPLLIKEIISYIEGYK